MIVKNSEEENFVDKLIRTIKGLNTENIQSKKVLGHIVQSFANDIKRIWYKHSKFVNITKHFKV